MDKTEYYIFQLFPLSRIVIISILWYLTNNILLGVMLFTMIQFLHYRLVSYFKGMIPLINTDKIFVNNEKNEDYLGICFLEVSKGKQKEFIDFYINKAFKEKEKLRSYLTFFFGEYWWKTIPFKKAISLLKITYMKNTIIKDSIDMCNFSQRELKIHIDIHNGQIPYEIFVFDNPESLPLVAFKFHHILSDGMGFVATFMSMTNNYSPAIFPFKFTKPSLVQWIMFYSKMILKSPFYIFDLLFTNLYRINCGPSSFKYNNHNHIIFPSNITPKALTDLTYQELKQVKNGITNKETYKKAKDGTLFVFSKNRNLQDYTAINKHLKITFNDLVFSIVSLAIKKFYHKRGYDKKEIGIICPINLRGIPDNFEDAKLENNTIGLGMNFPLLSGSLFNQKQKMKFNHKDVCAVFFAELMFRFLVFFFPEYVAKKMYGNTLKLTDLIITNLGGPKEKVYFNDIELTNFYPFLTTGLQGTFITLSSYANKFSFCIGVNEGIDLNPIDILEMIEAEFDIALADFRKILDNK